MVSTKILRSLLYVLLISLSLFANEDGKISIAVLDFQNTSGKAEFDYLQKSLSEMLITSLAQKNNFTIVERNRLNDALTEVALGETGVIDQDKAVEVGRAVGAHAILTGSYIVINDVIRINARIIDIQSATILKAKSTQGAADTEIFALVDELSHAIEEHFKLKVTSENGESRITTDNNEQPKVKSKRGKRAAIILTTTALIGGGTGALIYFLKKDDKEENNNNSTVLIDIDLE